MAAHLVINIKKSFTEAGKKGLYGEIFSYEGKVPNPTNGAVYVVRDSEVDEKIEECFAAPKGASKEKRQDLANKLVALQELKGYFDKIAAEEFGVKAANTKLAPQRQTYDVWLKNKP